MSKRVNLSSVDYKRSIRGKRRAEFASGISEDDDDGMKMVDQSGQILMSQVNSLKKTTTFRRRDFASIASQLQNRGVAWNPMSETMRKSSVKPPKYSKDDLINTYFYALKYTILAAIEPRLKTPDQSIFEFLNEEFKKWDKEVFNSKKLLSLDEVRILLQCMKIHADYLKTQLESESSEVFIPLSLVKVEKIEGITFPDVLKIVLTNLTQGAQENPGIKEYVVAKIKYILFLASFDFELTKRIFDVK